jgi:hypothetical protein
MIYLHFENDSIGREGHYIYKRFVGVAIETLISTTIFFVFTLAIIRFL